MTEVESFMQKSPAEIQREIRTTQKEKIKNKFKGLSNGHKKGSHANSFVGRNVRLRGSASDDRMTVYSKHATKASRSMISNNDAPPEQY